MNPILPSLQPVLKERKFVFTDEKRIKELAPEIAKEELNLPEWRDDVFIKEDSRKTIDFFMLANTINFAYMDFDKKIKFETEYKGKKYRGAYAMFACLKRALDECTPLFDADFLSIIDKVAMSNIFRGNIEIPMIDERLKIFNEVGEFLGKKYKGHFYNLVESSSNRAFDDGRGIVDKLVNDFPSFDDRSNFNDNIIFFYKRAQLAVMSVYERLKDKNLFDIEDVDDLTVAADYVLPCNLRGLGILRYEGSLEDRVNKQKIIEKDSKEELEIRANTISASELLKNEINKYREKGNKINSLHIDYRLWAAKCKDPHHLTKTIFY